MGKNHSSHWPDSKLKRTGDWNYEYQVDAKVFHETDIEGASGVVWRGRLLKPLAGDVDHPTERLTVALVSFEPRLHWSLHWRLIEVFYYVISGRAVMKDIEGRSYDIRAGNVAYASPGIAGSHSWEIKEKLQLITIRAMAVLENVIQFDVVPVTKEPTMPARTSRETSSDQF